MIKMFRVWFSRFWKNNKYKIVELGKVTFLLGIVAFTGYFIMTFISDESKTDKEDETVIYKPSSTVLVGKDVSKDEYTNDSKIIDEFIQYCNLGNANDAYSYLTDECKKIFYPTLEDFKKEYLNEIFDKKRIYNLQSWIVKDKKVIYRIRILDDLLSTGSYTESVKYQDYITLDRNNEESKISINGFIENKQLDIVEETEEFYARVLEKRVYMDYEEYTITVKNLTKNSIYLDPIESYSATVLVGKNDVNYYIENIKEVELLSSRLKPGITRKLNIKFKKNYSAGVESDYIEFKNIIRDVVEYENNINTYTDKTTLKINL